MIEERQNSDSTQANALHLLGEIFITGVPGLEMDASVRSFLKEGQIGGVIFFSHNYENPAQIAEYTNEIQECRQDLPLWIAADYEGGRVQRFKKGFTRIPDALTLGSNDSASLAFDLSQVIARELKAVGINLNFAPVLDILTNPKNQVIGNRAFGKTAEEVSKMGTAFVRGHLKEGVQPCIKHFPGHGDTSTDSHFALPKIEVDEESLLKREWLPFIKAIKSRCNFIMTAHILNPKLDPEMPATLSRLVVSDILRKKLRFKGVIVTDDLEMKAVADHFGADEVPQMAIEAGCDLLIYRTHTTARLGYNALKKAVTANPALAARVIESAQRIRKLKEECLLPYRPLIISDVGKHLATPENLAIATRVIES